MLSTRYSRRILIKPEFSRPIFEKILNIKIHQIPSSSNRVVPRGQADRQTDMTKITVAFRNFANARKNVHFCVAATTHYKIRTKV